MAKSNGSNQYTHGLILKLDTNDLKEKTKFVFDDKSDHHVHNTFSVVGQGAAETLITTGVYGVLLFNS